MRLDVFLTQNFCMLSRAKAQEAIKNGDVQVDGKVVLKPSFEVEDNDVKVAQSQSFVSRGAYKLLGAVQNFGLNFEGKTVLDIGASTGGFTQVCLQKGAKKVYAVDVGEGQLDESLVKNDKVINIQKTDVRNLQKEMVYDCDLVVGDISFISLQKILPHIKKLFGNIEMVLLFKPQFECGKDIAKRYKGVVKDSKLHEQLLQDFAAFLSSLEFKLSNLTFSPVCGKEGNIEHLVHINGASNHSVDVGDVVSEAFKNFKVSKNKK